jgi:restriction system-associated AAA family ATPase
MRLLRVHVIKADTCGGLLDGLDLSLRRSRRLPKGFDPLCLIGPNGTGKSQFLQVIAEIFQSVFHAVVPSEERVEGNSKLQFEIEYLIRAHGKTADVHVRVARKPRAKGNASIVLQTKQKNGEWAECEINERKTVALLPRKIIGYTSGDNETLSLPFLLSRSGYADEVYSEAVKAAGKHRVIPDTRLMLIDYGTHLEVLVSNLIFATNSQRNALLEHARLKGLHSFRCIVQLAHSAAPKAPTKLKGRSARKGIQLTPELEKYLDQLKRCSTCWLYEEKTEKYTFDYFVDEQTVRAFSAFWASTLELYSALHKLAMLNDLAIPKPTRTRFRKQTEQRRYAARLPEPQDEDKVFRFEQVNFAAEGSNQIVDYVSLSDGEHQLAQLLGTFCMISFPDVLFLLDEPESHFNPQWRVKFVSRLLDLPTAHGTRRKSSDASRQDALLTTHAPFVPSDMPRDRLFIFGKDEETGRIVVKRPGIETYGTTFDAILDECFNVRPPISEEPRKTIGRLMKSRSAKEIKEGMEELGPSVDKAFLADRLRHLAQ